MARPMILKPGQKMQLPSGTTYSGGLGWSNGDLDLHFLRRQAGIYVPVSWFNKDWWRPDLGVNRDPDTGQENPFIAPPEEDIIHCGDDRSGKSSAAGYDEKFQLLPGKAPIDVDEYIAFATVYDEDDEGLTLGTVEDIVCGVKDDASGHELQIKVADQFGFHVSARLAKWTKDANGAWHMENDTEGFGDADIFSVFQDKYKVVIPEHWKN